jgi:hypothetical protein
MGRRNLGWVMKYMLAFNEGVSPELTVGGDHAYAGGGGGAGEREEERGTAATPEAACGLVHTCARHTTTAAISYFLL